MLNTLKFILALAVATLLFGCSDDDSDSTDYDDSSVQFYNLATDSRTTLFSLNNDDIDVTIGSAAYTDVISTYAAESGHYQYTLSYFDDNDVEVDLLQDNITLKNSDKNIVMLTGSFLAPQVEVMNFVREDLENEMRMQVMNLSSKSFPITVSFAEVGVDTSQSILLDTLSYAEYAPSTLLPLSDYYLLLTNANTGEVIFQSESIPLEYSIEYALIIRDSYGPSTSKLSVDVIGNSTTPANYDDLDALAQFRVINAENDLNNLAVQVNGKTPLELTNLLGHEASQYQQVEFGDYQLNALDNNGELLVANQLLTLNQNDSKTLIFYRDKNNELTALNFQQQVLPSSFEHQVHAINLIDDYDNVKLFFVQDDETIESSLLYLPALAFSDVKTITLNQNNVSIYLVNEDNNEQQTLLARLDNVDLSELSHFVLIADEHPDVLGNYILTLIE